jgi:hypothetical protein
LQRALSTIVLLGLLLATAAAFAITEHLKLIKSPIYAPDVAKTFSPGTNKAEIKFKLRHPDSVTVTIVDSGGHEVATIAHGADEPKNVFVKFYWDGRTPTGIAPDGSVYQPQVKLANDRRTILMPNKIEVDTTPPKVLSARDGDGILIRGGHHAVAIRYAFAEPAHAAVDVNGRQVVFGKRTSPSGKVKWSGRVRGKMLPAGRYVLEVAAVDRAGNETPPAERKRVVIHIRDIALGETPKRVAPGARFAVKVRTGAPHYAWRFGGAHGIGTKKVLHLRAPAHRGRYRLVVSEHGHATTAVVIVGPKK